MQPAKTVIARLHKTADARSKALLKIHVRRAYIHVESCRATNKRILDCCSENGDLFFMLSFLSGLAGGDAEMLQSLLGNMIDVLGQDVSPQKFFLSKRELATMAE